MNSFDKDNHILVVDRQDYWRELSTKALTQKGYLVRALSDYDYSQESAYFDGQPPDLVILGCARIGHEEQAFIRKVMDDRCRLVVLSTSLPWGDMRSLFLAGANDVADKTYDPDHIINLVKEAFENVAWQGKEKRLAGRPQGAI